MKHSKPRPDDINERALAFACQVIEPFVTTLPDRVGLRRLNEIALRESRESVFWLSVCRRTNLGDQIACEGLLDEARQLARIIAAITVSTKRNGL